MSNENETQEEEIDELEEDGVLTSDPKAQYIIKNVSRGRHNRTLRAQNPAHYRQKHHIGGEHRLRRGRSLVLTEEQLLKHLPELMEKERVGVLEVFTMDGRRIFLNDRKVSPPPVSPPRPNPLPDSAARDIPAGQPMPMLPGGVPVTDVAPALDSVLASGVPGPMGATEPAPPPVPKDIEDKVAAAQAAATSTEEEFEDEEAFDEDEPEEGGK